MTRAARFDDRFPLSRLRFRKVRFSLHHFFVLALTYIPAGRLESLINFQSLTTSLTGLDIANASLLDEGTAAAEGMIMAFGQAREKRKTIFVDRSVLPQTVGVAKTRAEPFGIKVVVGDVRSLLSEESGDKEQHKDLLGVLVQVRRVLSIMNR